MSGPKRPGLLGRLFGQVLQQERPLYRVYLYIYVLEFVMLLVAINPHFKQILIVTGIGTKTSLEKDISRLLVSVGVIILQLFLNVSIVRLTYIPMTMLIWSPTPIDYVTLLVTLAGICIDLCKASSTLVYMWNLEGETHSEIKAFYYLLHFFAIAAPDNLPWMSLLCTLLCLALLVFRMMNPVSILPIQIVQELWSVGAILSLLTKCIVGFKINFQLYASLTMTVTGLLLYIVVRTAATPRWVMISSHSFHDLKLQGIYLSTMEKVFSYLVGPVWDRKSNEEMARFLGHYSALPQLCVRNKHQYLLTLYGYLSEQKDQYGETFRYWSLMAQLDAIVRCNIPSLILTIQLMKAISQDYCLPRRLFRLLQVNKLDQLLQDRVNNLIQRADRKLQQDLSLQLYIANHAFISSCERATCAYIRVWQSLREKQNVAFHLDTMIQQVSRVREQYARLGDSVTKYSVFTYMEYLYLVQRNLGLCHQVCNHYDLSYFKEVDYHIFGQSMYICIGIEGDIIKASHGQVLGFRKSQLQGGHIDLLIPPFARKSHSSMMADFFDTISNQVQAQRIVNFSKFALAVNSQGYLRKINIRLKACIVDFELRLNGIIQVSSTESFMAFKESDHKIVGSSFCLGQLSNSPIQALTDLTFDQVKKTLAGGRVQIREHLQGGMILSHFSLVSKIEVCQDTIWIISNNYIQDSQLPVYMDVDVKDPTQKYPRLSSKTNSKISEFLQKKGQFLNAEYSLRNFVFKSMILGLIYVVLTCVVGLKYNNLNELYSQRVQYCQQTRVLVLQTINTHRVLDYIHYADFNLTSAINFPDVNYASVLPVSLLIVDIMMAFPIMHKYPASNITEALLESSDRTNNFLLMKSVLVNVDWVLSMIQLEYYKIVMPLVGYIELNAMTIVDTVLPYYQNLVLLSSGRLIMYNNLQLAFTIVVCAALTALAAILILFTQKIRRKRSYLNGLLFDLSDFQLEDQIKLCRVFQSGVTSKLGEIKDVVESPTSLKIKYNPRMFTEASLIQNSAFLTTQPEADDPRLQIDIDQILVPHKVQRTNSGAMPFWFMGLVVCFILTMGGIVGASYYLNRNQQVPIQQYVESALALQSQYQAYMKVYLQLLNTLSLNSPPSSLQSVIDGYNSSSSDQYQSYNDALFSNIYFASYQKKKGEFSFSPMCQFMQCDGKYIDLLNITFSSSVLMSFNLVTAIYSEMVLNPDGTLNKVQLSKSLLTDQRLNYLVYVAGFYSDIFADLMGQLFDCMVGQVEESYQTEQTLHYTMLGLSVAVTLVIGVTFMSQFGKETTRAAKVLGLFHHNSYYGL